MAAVGLPDLSSEFALASGIPEKFQQDGFVFLDQLCPQADLAPYKAVIEEVTMREAEERAPMEERGTYAKAFIQIGNLWQKDDSVAQFVLAERFAKVAADLLGVEGVRLYHDQALFKEPGGGPTPWHQDQFYWPLEGVKTITMWMPLVDVPPEMMGMTFAKGSHLEGAYTSMAISDESNRFDRDLIEEKGFEIVQIAGMKAGDANFHAGWTIHGAPGNATDLMRAAMTVIYFEDGARISKPDHDNRQRDLEAWFPGQRPGEIAASPLNPVVYSQNG